MTRLVHRIRERHGCTRSSGWFGSFHATVARQADAAGLYGVKAFSRAKTLGQRFMAGTELTPRMTSPVPRSLSGARAGRTIGGVSDKPPSPAITRRMKLSEVQRLLKERRPIDRRARMVRSIQQSLRVEGYEVAAEVVAKAVEDVFRARGWP